MACSVLARFTMFWIFFSQNSWCILLLVVPLQGNDTFRGSTFTVGVFSRGPFRVPLRGTDLLLSCSRSTSLDSAFLQRRATLPIIETQKSPWNVSDMSVSRKNNEVTVWIMRNLFFFQPFHSHTSVLFQRSIFPLHLDGPLRQQALLVVS